MDMQKNLKLLVLFLMGAFVMACGGDDDDETDTGLDDTGIEEDAGDVDDEDTGDVDDEDTGDIGEDTDTGSEPTLNLVETAQGNADFSLLVEAVIHAELVDALSDDDDLTVFAPTNAAFEAADLDSEAIAAMEPADLAQILLYHVIADEVLEADVSAGAVATVNGA